MECGLLFSGILWDTYDPRDSAAEVPQKIKTISETKS
jgi:hypothetical protein